MTNPSAGDTVKTSKTKPTTNAAAGGVDGPSRAGQSRAVCNRKRRRNDEPLAAGRGPVPEKTQRRDDERPSYSVLFACHPNERRRDVRRRERKEERAHEDKSSRVADVNAADDHDEEAAAAAVARDRPAVTPRNDDDDDDGDDDAPEACRWYAKKRKQEIAAQPDTLGRTVKRDELARMRKTIQWLGEGARRLREDLANTRTELHEERKAAKILRRETETAVREARAAEAAKYQLVVADLKSRLGRSSSADSACVTPSSASSTSSLRAEIAREENHRRETLAMKRRLAEAEKTIRRLTWESTNPGKNRGKTGCGTNGSPCPDHRRLELEIRNLRATNEKLEEKLRIAVNTERTRTNELRIQHENHEVELSMLRKSLRSETIKMMDELRGKNREIERLSKLAQVADSRKRRNTAATNDVPMRKFRESGRNGTTMRSIGRAERKILTEDGRMMDSYILEVGCDRQITEVEVERLRELALEQQEVIEILRQAVKERERKLEQLSNKRRKEEFYRQWLELEPVAEVEDEEDHEEGDSALSSAPSSLSPQPGGCAQWQGNGVTREAYEAVLVEIEDLQTKLTKERQELSRAKTQVRDLEQALSEETRCGTRNAELEALSEKLRDAEEREAGLLVELSELREQNELLEFRLLELEETPARRETPDRAADSGVVSPEPVHLQKEPSCKPRSRAVATVIPYTNNNRSVSPVPQKPPLSLQESGIFEQDDEDELEIELASRGTQTEVPGGELLQEVQRLQELRTRLQERVSKVSNLSASSLDATVDSIVQLSSYQDRVRQLEERLEAYEEAEESRTREQLLSKHREEELLDENYRLTERVYWLENELRNLEEILSKREDNERIERVHKETTTESLDLFEESMTEEDRLNRTCSTAVQTIDDSPGGDSMPCTHYCVSDRPRDRADFAQQCALGGSRVTVESCTASLLSSGIVEEIAKEATEREQGQDEREEEIERSGSRRQLSTAVNFSERPDPEKKVIYFRWR